MKRGYRTPFSYFDLIETFPKPGCAICTLTRRDVERHVDLMLYGFVSTDEMQAIFQAARGLCPQHGEMAQRNKLGNVIGITRLYVATLNEVLDIMERTPVADTPKSGLSGWLRPKEAATDDLAAKLKAETICPVCAALEEFEQEYVGIFGRFMGDARFQAALRESEGLCLPHFRQVIGQLNGDEARLLVEIQRDIWTQLRAEMELFLEKQEYERDDAIGAEGDSWVRAIQRMAGDKTIFGLRRRSGS